MIPRHNNLSDLEIAIPFVDEEGAAAGIPAYDFEIDFYTNERGRRVTASQKNGVLTNCSVEDGNLLVCHFDRPRLGRGRLKSRKTWHIPDPDFQDEEYTLVQESVIDLMIY